MLLGPIEYRADEFRGLAEEKSEEKEEKVRTEDNLLRLRASAIPVVYHELMNPELEPPRIDRDGLGLVCLGPLELG